MILNDTQNQLTHTWGATSPIRYEYDLYGRMTAMHTWRTGDGGESSIWPATNTPLSDITRWHYHEATGLLEEKEDALGQKSLYSYLPGGKLHTRTWARTSGGSPLVTTYTNYPETGELATIDYSDTTPDIGFSYYRTGQQKTISDAVGSRTFIYTDNLLADTETITGLLNQDITRTYDTTGVVGRYTGFTTGSNHSITYDYDPMGQFNEVSWNSNNQTDTVLYTRVPNSQLLHTTSFASGATSTYSYEPNRNVKTAVQNRYTTTPISQYDYVYDNIGRRTSMTTTGDVFIDAMGPPMPQTPEEQLMAKTLVNVGTASSVDYTRNTINQYSRITTDGVISDPNYDADGNLIEDDRFSYSWNSENRLIAVTPDTPVTDDKKLDFTYDYMGRRVQKSVSTWNGNTWQSPNTSLFVYDGWNMIKELNGTGQTQAIYIHGLDLSQSLQGAGGIGGILARIDHGTSKVHTYFYDANGNVGQLVDSTDGTIAAAYEYAPFGGLISSTGLYAEVNPFRFSSKYLDGVSGLYYYGYRYYSPELGRWPNRDPIGERGGLNLYGFVGNRPSYDVDILGLDVYIVYREFNEKTLGKGYRDGSSLGIGHYYLAFDNENVDVPAWNKLVDKLSKQHNPRRSGNPASETFSFHPWNVRVDNNGNQDFSNQIAGNILTNGAFIGYNDKVDVKAFANQRYPGSVRHALNAKIFKLTTSQQKQFSMYREAIRARNITNRRASSSNFGTYKLFLNNCGSWAVFMAGSHNVKVPDGVKSKNVGGAGVGGVQDYLPFTYAVTGGAMVLGQGEFGAITLNNGDVGAGITWRF